MIFLAESGFNIQWIERISHDFMTHPFHSPGPITFVMLMNDAYDPFSMWLVKKKSLFQVQLGTVDLSTASVDQFFETKGWNGMTFPKFRKLGMYGFLWLPILIYMYLCCLYAISGNSGGIFWSLINIWQQDGWFQRKSPAKWRTTDWPCYNWFQHGTGNVRKKKWVRI